MSYRSVCLGLALVTLYAPSMGRGQTPAPTAAPPPRYEVEILVFAHREFDAGEERFEFEGATLPNGELEPPLAPPVFDITTLNPQVSQPLLLPQPPPPPTNELSVATEDPLAVRPLLPTELKLGAEYRKLQVIAAYEPLLHGGWVQPGLPEADAQPIELRMFGTRNPRGTVRVHLSRFLHVTLDVTYEAPPATPANLSADDTLTEIPLAPRYRLTTTRNVRSNELHYFDHPAFGVLVRVTPRAAPGGAPGRRPAA